MNDLFDHPVDLMPAPAPGKNEYGNNEIVWVA